MTPGSQCPHNQDLSLTWAEDVVVKFKKSNLKTNTISFSLNYEDFKTWKIAM